MLPRIYSISTVGVTMHYNQDYLVHPTRTDFTGENGAGKSIIADILQLIFVHDPKLIRYGTEGVKRREYYTLPIDTNEAFAFINIEVFENQMITIGVCLPNKKGRPIRPFVISKNTDLKKNIKDLVYPKDEWITSAHFIKNGKFLNITELAKHLRDEYKVYFRIFEKRTDKDTYYSFLFEKGIIPINLGREDNRKAFAKIIQSFSKAKSLDLYNSNDLKQFIFENRKEEFRKQFDHNKANLDKLIRQYQETVAYIANLKKKDESLSKLKQKENDKTKKNRIWSEAEVRYFCRIKDKAFEIFDKSKKVLNESLKRQNVLKNKQSEVSKSLTKATDEVAMLETSLKYFRPYKETYEKCKSLKKDKQELIDTKPPDILEKIEKQIDVNQFDIQEIKRRINEFKPVYEKYGSVAAMSKKVEEQKQIIENRKAYLNATIEQINTIVTIIDNNKTDTLFSKILEKGEPISEAQETILFSLIDVNWKNPSEAKSGIKYTDTLDILNEDNIKPDDKGRGFWFKTGDLYEFIPSREERQLFDNVENIKRAISEKKIELEKKVIELKNELTQIENFDKGKVTDKLSINGYDLDDNLYGYDVMNRFEETAAIIQNLNTKISKIDSQLGEYQKALTQNMLHIQFEIDDNNLDTILEEYGKKLEDKRKKEKAFINEEAQVKADLKSLNEVIIPNYRQKKSEKEAAYKKTTQDYIEKQTYFENNYPKIAQNFDESIWINKNNLDEFEENMKNAKHDYEKKYIEITAQFQETKERGSVEINTEIDDGNFDFTILEKVLLGQIKHTDNIADHLKSINDKKLKIAERVCDMMLKVFQHTKGEYTRCKRAIRDLNAFFKDKDRKINKKYFLEIDFTENDIHKISWLEKLRSDATNIVKEGELFKGISPEEYIENFYSRAIGLRGKKDTKLSQLLDPQIYFDLKVRLTDENHNETGSTGQTYAAIVMLCIGRLSGIETGENKQGIRFMILEETASLDKTNFKTFPNIAKEFGYQIFTMTPEPYDSDATQGWYLYELLKGTDENNINHEPLGFFRTNQKEEDLNLYIKKISKTNELESIEKVARSIS